MDDVTVILHKTFSALGEARDGAGMGNLGLNGIMMNEETWEQILLSISVHPVWVRHML